MAPGPGTGRGWRCDACTAANRRAERHRERQILYGRWEPYVDAAPARDHVRALAAAGVGWKRAAELAGVSTGAVSKLLYGGPAGRPPSRRIRPQTAAAILAVRPSAKAVAPGTLVDSAGTRRRIQALVARGWSQARLAHQLTLTAPNFGTMTRRGQVTAATARAVRELYDRLWDKPPPESNQRQRIAAARARNYAAQRAGLPRSPGTTTSSMTRPLSQPRDGSGPRGHAAAAPTLSRTPSSCSPATATPASTPPRGSAWRHPRSTWRCGGRASPGSRSTTLSPPGSPVLQRPPACLPSMRRRLRARTHGGTGRGLIARARTAARRSWRTTAMSARRTACCGSSRWERHRRPASSLHLSRGRVMSRRTRRRRAEACYGPEVGTTYLLHFIDPATGGSARYKHAGHYIGWTTDLAARLEAHAAGTGARLIEVITRAGLGFTLARTWPQTTRDGEDLLKHVGDARRFCPACGVKPRQEPAVRMSERRRSAHELERDGTWLDGMPLPHITTYPTPATAVS